ncbi:hypothetical protein BGW37DRAFT_555812 [Umbelopsis sp. PMI_123]|nr:hypothetical protein BGW37DRAFT_555812 [Umbelopsis sp. PMI_123]
MSDTDKSKEGKKSRHTLSYQEQQQRQLQKLFDRVDKPIVLPEPPKDKTLKPPPDVVRNVQGSSAGAGSGEFHVYRALRRKEYTRLKEMDEQEAKEKEAKEYAEKLTRMKAEDEERTAKNRAKRRRKNKDNKSEKKAKTEASEAGTKTEEKKEESKDE